MKISCILTSYNRPNFVRHSLDSIVAQTHRDFELLIYDDSSAFDINEVLKLYRFPSMRLVHTDVAQVDRCSQNRLSINCNRGLKEATGDVICFLCDDDYYFPTWFSSLSRFFSDKNNSTKDVAYGVLVYTRSAGNVLDTAGRRLFPKGPLDRPACQVDHNQVAHRRFDKPFTWPETRQTIGAPDAVYFKSIAISGRLFYQINEMAVMKRIHGKNLQQTYIELGTSDGEKVRE